MRLVQLPIDPDTFVNLDMVSAVRLRTTGAEGEVTFPTTLGRSVCSVQIVDGCSVELEGPDGVWLWDRYADPTTAASEMGRIQDLAAQGEGRWLRYRSR